MYRLGGFNYLPATTEQQPAQQGGGQVLQSYPGLIFEGDFLWRSGVFFALTQSLTYASL